MVRSDVLVVGGGPGGSACAWALARQGLDVTIVDRAAFPRDKPCAGWITPQVLETLEIDPREYGRGRVCQPITAFRVGTIDSDTAVDVAFGHPVSYGIRRCEFDQYLLERSGAQLYLSTPVANVQRQRGGWVVNGAFGAPVLVGAGGHRCPVAHLLNGGDERGGLVVAQEAEWPLATGDASPDVDAERPELYFSPDLAGYGWCFRKGGWLNLGIGRVGGGGLIRARRGFTSFLAVRGRVADAPRPWRGHAYLLSTSLRRSVVDDGVVLVGDAAGLAHPASGEGVRPAIESGVLAARAILGADGAYSRARLGPYARALDARRRAIGRIPPLPAALARATLRALLGRRWFARDVVLRRWFLRASEPALAAGAN